MNSAISANKPDSGIAPALQAAKPPVLILSSQAGLGNYAVGQALLEQSAFGENTFHYPVETFLEDALRRQDFSRYRWICHHAPWLLHMIYRFPASYWLKCRLETLRPHALPKLKKFIQAQEISTLIATNHRAAFWAGSLKKQGLISCGLWAVLTDYHVNSGWEYIFWDATDRFLGPIPKDKIPAPMRRSYAQIPFPLRKEILSETTPFPEGEKNHVLITGGAWGLGPIEKTVGTLHRAFPELQLHVACGDNEKLRQRLNRLYASDSRIRIHDGAESFVPLMKQCRTVITKPGAVTLTEAYQARRMIFLLPGLPETEQANARYARQNFSAKAFSLQSFGEWYHAG